MPVPGTRLSLANLPGSAQTVLDAFVTQLTKEGVDLPGRQYVAPGAGAQAIAWDGPQFNVAFVDAHQGQPGMIYGGTQHPAATVLLGQWAVLLLRTIPGLSGNTTGRQSIPSAKAINKSAYTNLTDVGALINAAITIHQAGTFGPVGVGFSIDSCQPLGPAGELAGARLLFSTSFAQ